MKYLKVWAMLLSTGIASNNLMASSISCQSGSLGQTCDVKLNELFNESDAYPLEVYLFIPKKFNHLLPWELILHFHGYRWEENFQKDVLDRTNFLKHVSDSEKNQILVLPKSLGRCETFHQYFSLHAHRFNIFLNHVVDVLSQQTSLFSAPNKLSLSFHSGSFVLAAQLLKFKRQSIFFQPRRLLQVLNHTYDFYPLIRDVYLFDAQYSVNDQNRWIREEFIQFAKNALNQSSESFLSFGDKTTLWGNYLIFNEIFNKKISYQDFLNQCPWNPSKAVIKKRAVAIYCSNLGHYPTLDSNLGASLAR